TQAELGTAQGGVPVMRRAQAATPDRETNMKRWMTLLAAALAIAVVPLPAHATGPAIDWDPAYMWQPGGTPANLPAGGPMRFVGTVSVFGPPLDYLNPTLPATEYTFTGDSLVSLGTRVFGPPATQIDSTSDSRGVIEG